MVLVHLLQVDAPVLGVERKLFLEKYSRLCGFIFIDLSSFVHTDSIKDSALSGFIFTDLSSFVHTHSIKDSALSSKLHPLPHASILPNTPGSQQTGTG